MPILWLLIINPYPMAMVQQVRMFRYWEVIDDRFSKDVPSNVASLCTAYANGLNYYASLHESQVISFWCCTVKNGDELMTDS